MDTEKDYQNRKLLEETVRKMIKDYLSASAFTDRKLTDTPTDDLMTVNRKYVNMYGTTAQRPTSRIPGKFYFDTTIGRPVYFNPNSSVWTDGAGSVS